MCNTCRDEADYSLHHFTFFWVRCGCHSSKPYRIYNDPTRIRDTTHPTCGQPLRRTSDPRVHRSVKRPIVLHERTLPDGQIQQWAPFTPDTPPPPHTRVREITSIRDLERLAAAGDVHDLLKYNESQLDSAIPAAAEIPDDPLLSPDTLFNEELTMRQQLGLSTNESAIRESIADTNAIVPDVPRPG